VSATHWCLLHVSECPRPTSFGVLRALATVEARLPMHASYTCNARYRDRSFHNCSTAKHLWVIYTCTSVCWKFAECEEQQTQHQQKQKHTEHRWFCCRSMPSGASAHVRGLRPAAGCMPSRPLMHGYPCTRPTRAMRATVSGAPTIARPSHNGGNKAVCCKFAMTEQQKQKQTQKWQYAWKTPLQGSPKSHSKGSGKIADFLIAR